MGKLSKKFKYYSIFSFFLGATFATAMDASLIEDQNLVGTHKKRVYMTIHVGSVQESELYPITSLEIHKPSKKTRKRSPSLVGQDPVREDFQAPKKLELCKTLKKTPSVISSSTPITNCPLAILVTILRYLPGDDFSSISLVNKMFNTLHNNSRFMDIKSNIYLARLLLSRDPKIKDKLLKSDPVLMIKRLIYFSETLDYDYRSHKPLNILIKNWSIMYEGLKMAAILGSVPAQEQLDTVVYFIEGDLYNFVGLPEADVGYTKQKIFDLQSFAFSRLCYFDSGSPHVLAKKYGVEASVLDQCIRSLAQF